MEFHCCRSGICCQAHRVPVTRADALRLLQGPSAPLSGWKDLESCLEFLHQTQLDMSEEPESLVPVNGAYALPVLAQREGACVFLERSPEGASCGVHEFRPRACRSYPFGLHRSSPRGLRLLPQKLCPKDAGEEAGTDFEAELCSQALELRENAEHLLAYRRRERLRRAMGKAPSSLQSFLKFWTRPSLTDNSHSSNAGAPPPSAGRTSYD